MTTLTKPLKRTVQAKMPHGFKDRLVLTIYPGGVVGVREIRRRDEVLFNLGELYAKYLVRAALAEKRKGRR